MIYTIEELTTPLTREQIQANIYTAIATYGTDATRWAPHNVVRVIIYMIALILAALSTLTSNLAKSAFLSTAAGPWLALKAKSDFGVDKNLSTFATGTIRLTNAGGGVYNDIQIGDLTVSNGFKSYRNTAVFSLGASTFVDQVFAAVESGAASSAAVNTITLMITPLTGVSVTNQAAFVALDDESDPDLRTRAASKLGTLSPATPKGAYEFWAKAARRGDGTLIGVNRVRVFPTSNNAPLVYVAVPAGAVPGTVDNLSTDLGRVADSIQRNAVGFGVFPVIASGANVVINVEFNVWAYDTGQVTKADLEARGAVALATFLGSSETSPIGGNVIGSDPGKVFLDQIRSIVMGLRSEIFRAVPVLPAADVVLTSSQIPALGTVTINLTLVPVVR